MFLLFLFSLLSPPFQWKFKFSGENVGFCSPFDIQVPWDQRRGTWSSDFESLVSIMFFSKSIRMSSSGQFGTIRIFLHWFGLFWDFAMWTTTKNPPTSLPAAPPDYPGIAYSCPLEDNRAGFGIIMMENHIGFYRSFKRLYSPFKGLYSPFKGDIKEYKGILTIFDRK